MSETPAPPPPLGLASGELRLQAYDSRWPELFRELELRLRRLVPRARIEHIGSTAVPGCEAKPIVDISVGLPSGERFGSEESWDAGFEFRSVRDYSAIFAVTGTEGRRVALVHVRALGSPAEIWDLRFRDFLRTHPESVRDYVEAKRRILAADPRAESYTAAKDPFVRGLVDRVNRWAEETGWSPNPPPNPPSTLP